MKIGDLADNVKDDDLFVKLTVEEFKKWQKLDPNTRKDWVIHVTKFWEQEVPQEDD